MKHAKVLDKPQYTYKGKGGSCTVTLFKNQFSLGMEDK